MLIFFKAISIMHNPITISIVEVLRFCHQLNVQGKCHYGESDIEPKGTEPVESIERSKSG